MKPTIVEQMQSYPSITCTFTPFPRYFCTSKSCIGSGSILFPKIVQPSSPRLPCIFLSKASPISLHCKSACSCTRMSIRALESAPFGFDSIFNDFIASNFGCIVLVGGVSFAITIFHCSLSEIAFVILVMSIP